MNSNVEPRAVHDDLREGGWLPQEAFVYLWGKLVKKYIK